MDGWECEPGRFDRAGFSWSGQLVGQMDGTLTANFSRHTHSGQLGRQRRGVWVAPVGQSLGTPIINDSASHGQTTDTATMTLVAGQDYNVEMTVSETTATVQQIQLQWSSPSTPVEDIEPATEVGLNVDGGDGR